MTDQSVGVRQLKANLSKYLRQVKAGKTLVITEHGRAVGRLTPVTRPLSVRLADLRRAGLIEWNGKRLPRSRPAANVRGKKSVAQLLIEERR
jgi:prevent-host-death family protein